jgi:single-stranded DNA-binding protein
MPSAPEGIMSGIECAFFGALARDAESKVSKSGKKYLRFTTRVGDGDAVSWVSVMAFDERATVEADKFLKGARVYVEGSIRLEEWTTQGGTVRHGLSCMSWHCRLSAIGRNKPKRDSRSSPADKPRTAPSRGDDFHDDAIPF